VRSFDRLETLTAIMPIAIIGVDLVPGICPTWYVMMQGLGALPLIAVAIFTRGRAVYPKPAKS
jgi:hypothetical protein